jgi:CHAT domain-containing protein/tetratricopeptide (TPR) repeat protein
MALASKWLTLLALLLLTLLPVRAAAEAPADKQPTPEERLKERNRYNAEARKLETEGRRAEAIAAVEKALAIERDVLGNQHADVAGSLRWLCEVRAEQGDFVGARQAGEECLAIETRRVGAGHWQTLDARLALKDVDLLERLTPAQRQRLAEATVALHRIDQLHYQARYGEALTLAEQALKTYRELLGTNHRRTGHSLAWLGMLHQAQGNYAGAEPLLRESLSISRQVLGPKHPDFAHDLNNVASLSMDLGDYARAEPLFHQALEIIKQTLGEKDRDYAGTLNNLALLYHYQGDYGRAEPLYRQALEVRQRVLGKDHADCALGLNNLAGLLVSRGDYGKALPLYQEALRIIKDRLGLGHPRYAATLTNLAFAHEALGDFAAAETHYLAARDIRGRTLGDQHPSYAHSLNNLALLYAGRGAPGDYARAEPLYLQALGLRRQGLGTKHPDYFQSLNNLAALHDLQGKSAQGEPLALEAVQGVRGHLELTAVVQSERQQLAMVNRQRHKLDTLLSIHDRTGSAAERVYGEVLRWKGSVAERQLLIRQSLATNTGEAATLFADLGRTSHALANLYSRAPAPKDAAAYRRHCEELSLKIERLEKELSTASVEFRTLQNRRQRTPKEIGHVLADGVVLIDLLQFQHYAPPKHGSGPAVWEQHLACFVVRRDGQVAYVNLGPVGPIARAISTWRASLGSLAAAAKAGQELRRLVWDPLAAHVAGARVILISPDGPLLRLPLVALPGPQPNSYLIEQVAIACVPVPQRLPELLAAPASATETPSLLVVGDVNYGGNPGVAVAAVSRSAPGGSGLDGLHSWKALPATGREARAIGDLFRHAHRDAKVTELSGDAATEAAVRAQVGKHRYLHFATHGFYDPPGLRSALAATASSHGRDLGGRQDPTGWTPGLLSGLVLTGANQTPDPDQDDGILTALELAGLDLGRTDLAVLSACQTGLGEAKAGGEGLLGLQRAFQTAGARTVVASLWSVDDAATQKLMTRFYDNLWQKKLPKLEALRQAQLSMLYDLPDSSLPRGLEIIDSPPDKRASPRLWAAWVLSGAPGDLSQVASIASAAPPAVAAPTAAAAMVEPRSSFPYWLVLLTGLPVLALAAWQWRRRASGAL